MNTENKVGALFNAITQNEDKSLTQIFEKFAKKWKLSRDSVRNMYYQYYSKILNSPNLQKKYNIEINKLSKQKNQTFTAQEKKWLESEVKQLLNLGYSIRGACYKLANGNYENMIRYQNKYRAMMKKEPENIISNNLKFSHLNQNDKSESEMSEDKNASQTSDKAKIIKMPPRDDILAEKDIQSLFMGLVRLVKSNTIKEIKGIINLKYREQENEIARLKSCIKVIENKYIEEKRLADKLQVELNMLKNQSLQKYSRLMQNLDKAKCEQNKI